MGRRRPLRPRGGGRARTASPPPRLPIVPDGGRAAAPRSPRRRRPPLAHRAGPSSSSSQLRVPAAVATAAAAVAAAAATVDSDSVPGRRATAAVATASAASSLPPAAAEAAPAAGAILLVGLLFLLLLLRPVARCPRPLPLPRAPGRPGDWGGDEGEAPPSGGGARGGEGRREGRRGWEGRARVESSESPAANAREGGPRRSPPTPGAHPHPEPPNWSRGPPALPHQRLCAQRRAARQTAREDWEISDVSIEPRTRSSLGFLSSRPSTPVPFHIPPSPSLPRKNLFLSRVVRILGPTRLALDTALTDSQREFSFPARRDRPRAWTLTAPKCLLRAKGTLRAVWAGGGGTERFGPWKSSWISKLTLR